MLSRLRELRAILSNASLRPTARRAACREYNQIAVNYNLRREPCDREASTAVDRSMRSTIRSVQRSILLGAGQGAGPGAAGEGGEDEDGGGGGGDVYMDDGEGPAEEPDLIILNVSQLNETAAARQQALDRVRQMRETFLQRQGQFGAILSGDNVATPQAQEVFQLVMRSAGFGASMSPNLREVSRALRGNLMRGGIGEDQTYLDRVREIIASYRDQTLRYGRMSGSGGSAADVRIARGMVLSDLQERMAIMRRNEGLAALGEIPIRDFTIQARLSEDAAAEMDPARFSSLVADALRNRQDIIPLGADPRSLLSVTFPQMPLINTDTDERTFHTVFTASVPIATLLNPMQGEGIFAGSELQLTMENEIAVIEQSKTRIDWENMAEEGFTFVVQFMPFPAANGWSPKLEAEQFFIKGTIREIPPTVYITHKICIPVAIMTAACREVMEDGSLLLHPFITYNLDDDDFVLFDSRELSLRTYCVGKENQIREMAFRMMELCEIEEKDLCLDSCAKFAHFLNVQIHVLYKEAMCRRMFRFGDEDCKKHVCILIENEHAFPVMRPWRLMGNGDDKKWCDDCHSLLPWRWSHAKICHHRLHCSGKSENDSFEQARKNQGREIVPRRFKPVYSGKDRSTISAPFCFTCNAFCMTIKEARGCGGHERVSTGKFEECVAAGHRIMDEVSMGQCTICNECLPIEWPSVADAPKETLRYVSEHRCYLSAPQLKIGEASKYYVWDIETVAVENVHVPIYIYARNLYDGSIRFEFYGMDSFCRKVISDEFKGTTWIAHNSGGFDSNFVHTWLEDHGVMHTRIPSPMSLHRSLETNVDHFNIRFIDSFSFLPMGLAKLGPAFNLPVTKGDFPHKFSSLERMDYSGPMPPCDTEEDWYNMSGMRSSSLEKSEVALAKFKAWHAEESQKYVPFTSTPWVYMDQLKSYCKLDCDVLAGALSCLRDSFVNVEDDAVTGCGLNAFKLCPVDPLAYLTMAQVCQQLYIGGLYASGSGFRIAHVPLPDRPQIPDRVRWLMEEEQLFGRPIWRASTRMREWIARDGQPVDGFAELGSTCHVWEYYNCLDRGCPSCTESDGFNEKFGCSNHKVYLMTQQRLRVLALLGYKLHVRWSHEDVPVAEGDDPDVYRCMAYQRQQNDGGFYGGRVEVFKPLWRCKKDEKINYIDVVSLYPWVCATQKMCTGHPTIYAERQIDMARLLNADHENAYFGFVHVHVRGNKDDYFGGVPRRDRETGRLVFDNTEYKVVCFVDELRERVKHGLEVLRAYELWDWSDPQEHVAGPMAGYVATFLRSKMECSGWKALCGRIPETEEEKKEVCDLLEEENLGLCRPRPDKVQDNPGGRQLAKLRLNMLWGKFVQTPCALTVKFISGYGEYAQLWFDNQVDKSTLQFRRLRDGLDMMEVRYGHTNSARAPSNTHYFLGASCTAQARLKLQGMLRHVGPERALYCDTDSVVYVEREDDEEERRVKTGEALGQWSSELDEGVWGEEFMALAPKCYLLQYNEAGRMKERESGIIKAKGVTLTRDNLKVIHADSMRKIILNEVFGDIDGDGKTFTVQASTFNIRMDHGGDRSMTNLYGSKVVRCVYSKRKIVVAEDVDVQDVHFIDTVPFC